MVISRPKKKDGLLAVIHGCIRTGRYRDTSHARQRQKERLIILPEIIHVLMNGAHEKSKDRFDPAFQEWNYAIRGKTVDGCELRIIVSFERQTSLLIITAFALSKKE